MSKNLLKKINSFDFFLLLCSFLYGNIFAIQYSTLDWGVIVIFGIVFFLELLNRFLYLFFNLYKKNKVQNEPSNSFLDNFKFIFKSGGVVKKDYVSNNELVKNRKTYNIKLVTQGRSSNPLNNFGTISPFFLLNTLKRGFLLGFFIEAFKVGS